MSEAVSSRPPSLSLMTQLRHALAMLVALTLLTGVAYPLAITLLAHLAFPDRSTGSLLLENGKPVGSRLVGQPFESPRYFWSRLSATTPSPYNAQASGASNLSPTNPLLTESARTRIAALRAADPTNASPVPVDLVTSSASGLDPHITLAAAEYQLLRVARARHLPPETVHQLIEAATTDRPLQVLGEPTVNVLQLNLSLDALPPRAAAPPRAALPL